MLEESNPKSSWLVAMPIHGGQGPQLGRGMKPAWGAGGIAYQRSAGLWLKPRLKAHGRLLLPQDGHVPLYPVGWSRDGRRLLAIAGTGTQPALQAVIISPNAHKATMLSPVFTDVNAISRPGTQVLGVLNGNVVSASADGSLRTLARNADEPSWNK